MNKRGFTLIELIVVIAIMVIIVSIGVPNYMKSLDKKEEEADEMAAYQLNDSTETFAMVRGASLAESSPDFIFSDCEVSGEYDTNLMIRKLIDNGFLISAPKIQSKNAKFVWDTVANKWIVDFYE